MKWNPITRRHFLQGIGATLSLPLLPSLFSEKAFAQAAGPVQKNFIGVCGFNGLFRMYGPQSQLMPITPLKQSDMAGYASLDLPGRHRVHSKPLSQMQVAAGGAISEIIDASFNPYLNKMLMMQGFDYLPLLSNHHAGQFGNAATDASGNTTAVFATLDQVLAHSTSFYKNPSLVKTSVGFTGRYGESFSGPGNYGACFTYENPADKINSKIVGKNAYYEPVTLWNQYFGSKSTTTPFKLTLVDQTLKDYQALRTSRKLANEDKVKLDQHIALLFETQTKVRAVAKVCNSLKPATSIADRELLLKTTNDVIASLISCGLCHSFLGWAHAIVSPEDSESWHRWSHEGYSNDDNAIGNAASYNNLIAQNRSVLKSMCLDLAKKLDAIGQLDQSLIAYIYEHNKRGHESWNIPVITFGSAGGVFKTGQYLDYRNNVSRDDLVFSRLGIPINQLWANILQAMDMPVTEIEALNKTAYSDSLFAPKSGYAASLRHKDGGYLYNGHYGTGWKGHNLSDWLPFIKA